jgi:hypothetical protein
MKKVLLNAIAMLSVPLMLAGCDWTTGGGVDTYNDSYNWVNFSGVYSGPKGYLVSQYTANPPTGTNVATQGLGTGSGGRRSFSVVWGSIGSGRIADHYRRGYVLSDNGSEHLLVCVGAAVDAIPGRLVITLPPMKASHYRHFIYTTRIQVPIPQHGVRIYALTVWTGRQASLQILRHNGSVYEGNLYLDHISGLQTNLTAAVRWLAS